MNNQMQDEGRDWFSIIGYSAAAMLCLSFVAARIYTRYHNPSLLAASATPAASCKSFVLGPRDLICPARTHSVETAYGVNVCKCR